MEKKIYIIGGAGDLLLIQRAAKALSLAYHQNKVDLIPITERPSLSTRTVLPGNQLLIRPNYPLFHERFNFGNEWRIKRRKKTCSLRNALHFAHFKRSI
jgi:hypothetical protein